MPDELRPVLTCATICDLRRSEAREWFHSQKNVGGVFTAILTVILCDLTWTNGNGRANFRQSTACSLRPCTPPENPRHTACDTRPARLPSRRRTRHRELQADTSLSSTTVSGRFFQRHSHGFMGHRFHVPQGHHSVGQQSQ